MPSSLGNVIDGQDTPQNHQYECIPEYFLTMSRSHHSPIVCHHHHHQTGNTCGVPYHTFSRSYLVPQGMPSTATTNSASDSSSPPSATTVQEESSTPLLPPSTSVEESSHAIEEISLPKSMMVGWTRRNPSTTAKRKSTEQKRHTFLSQLRKSSLLQE